MSAEPSVSFLVCIVPKHYLPLVGVHSNDTVQIQQLKSQAHKAKHMQPILQNILTHNHIFLH